MKKLPAFTLLDVTVSSPAEMLAAITEAEQAKPDAWTIVRLAAAWTIVRLAAASYRLIVWRAPVTKGGPPLKWGD